MNGLLAHVEQSIQARQLLKRGANILVAVSGGLDSMVLLNMLHALAAGCRWHLAVAHFNHRLRGRSSDADERLVRKTAAKLKLPIVVERADVRRFAARSKLSIEMAARKLRHEFFARAARARRIRTVALAHHADDQVELFFLRLLRGSGGEGLAGMKWRSPSPVCGSITLVRPLLDVAKAGLREFAVENQILFRDDATNFTFDAPRNRIRNELLPLLRRRYQPALTNTILRVMEIIGAESDFVDQAARGSRIAPVLWSADCPNPQRVKSPGASGIYQPASRNAAAASCDNSRSKARVRGEGANLENESGTRVFSDKFENLPLALQRRVLQLQLARLGVPADFDLIERLRETTGRAVSINSRLTVLRETGGTVKLQTRQPPEFNPNELALALTGPAGKAQFDGARLNWSFTKGNARAIVGSSAFRRRRLKSRLQVAGRQAGVRRVNGGPRTAHAEFFDADKVGASLTLRHWRPGDRFRPIGAPSAFKLQDWFVNQKIPAARRRELLVAVASNGEIFWIEGLRIGENFKLTPQTRRLLVWKWR